MAFAGFGGCAATPPAAAVEEVQDESDADAPASEAQALAPEAVDRSALPNQELTENLLYEFLLAEIAIQRGNATLSAQAYVDLAKRTRDPRIARRATEVAALYARMNNAAIDAATVWHETEPGSTRALEALGGLLVAAGRYDEALPSLKKLLASSAADPTSGFTQLTRTLANAQDKQAALKLVRSLAADYPKLAQAHFALAQAAVNAGEDRTALDEARRAGQLRPDWEAAVLLEAQLLQKVSVDQAASLLAAFLEQYPAARETRLAYARMLVAQKRFAEARAEFQKLMAGTPDSTDMAFAVALLSLQLKDYDSAERYLRGLLDGQYRDKDGVRLYLGQVAEERKNLPEALHWYGEVGEGEQYVPAQMRYAQILARQGKLDARNQRLPEARELIEHALQLAPDDSFIVDSMGWVLYRMGNLKDALGYLRRAFAGRPDAEIAAHLGEVLWALGERDEAERVWNDANRANPDNETLVNTIKRLKH